MSQLHFIINPCICSGIDCEQFKQLLDINYSAVFDGAFKQIGTVVNHKIYSTNCQHQTNKQTCSECHKLMSFLSTKLIEVSEVENDCLIGVIPNYNQVKQYPHMMYSMIKKMVKKLNENLLTDTEQQLIELFRKARVSYENDWDHIEETEVEKDQQNNVVGTSSLTQVVENHDDGKRSNLDSTINPIPKHRKTHNEAQIHPPKILQKHTPFEETFFIQFISNQLRNFCRPVRNHEFSQTEKRFWLLMKYFSGKTLFQRMFGDRNHGMPVNHFNHLQYNLIAPELSTLKSWSPKATIGLNPEIKYVFQSIGIQCRDVCISIDGMKVLHQIDSMDDVIVGLNTIIKDDYINKLNKCRLEDISDEMLLFHICSIDNSWSAPLGWYPISKQININRFIIQILREVIPLLQDYKLNLACACADGEVNAPKIESNIKEILPDFVFLTDYIHNFKNQRNCLFSRPILDGISMSTLIQGMLSDDRLYYKLDKEEVSPSDIMALRPCLAVTDPEVIDALKQVNISTKHKTHQLANYLEEIRKLYDIINDNNPNILVELKKSKQYFKNLNNYPEKTKNICLHTIKGFKTLIKKYKNLKPSAITTNYNELTFSIVRRKYPRPTVKQFCKIISLSFFVMLTMHASNDVRGFSLANIPLTTHYNGMNISIETLPDIKVVNHKTTIKLAEHINKEIANINKNIESHIRKTTLRLESCAPRKLYLICPMKGCTHQKPYVRKGNFKNHLQKIHKKGVAEATQITKEIECHQFEIQYKKDYLERRKSARINSEFGLEVDERFQPKESNNYSSQDTQLTSESDSQSNSSQNQLSIMDQLYNSQTFMKQNKPQLYVHSKYIGKIPIKESIDDVDIEQVQPYNGIHFAIIDVETTGFTPETSELIQISIYSLSTKLLHSIYIRPRSFEWNSKIKQLHSGKIEKLKQSPMLDEVASQITKYLTKNNTCEVVAMVHSTGLDKKFITDAFEIQHITFLNTMAEFFLARKSLEKLYSELGNELMRDDDCISVAHDASFDVVCLYDLLIHRWRFDDRIISRCLEHSLMKSVNDRNRQTTLTQFFK